MQGSRNSRARLKRLLVQRPLLVRKLRGRAIKRELTMAVRPVPRMQLRASRCPAQVVEKQGNRAKKETTAEPSPVAQELRRKTLSRPSRTRADLLPCR